MTDTPLSDARFAEIRQGQPTEWLPKPWKIHQVEGAGETRDSWQVLHDSTVLATLPDWAGDLALWMANAPDDIRDLLAEVERLRSKTLASADSDQSGARIRPADEENEDWPICHAAQYVSVADSYNGRALCGCPDCVEYVADRESEDLV